MSTSPQSIIIPISTSEHLNTLLGEYFQSDINGFPTEIRKFFLSEPFSSEANKISTTLEFMNEVAACGERVYCLYFPKNYSIPDMHSNVHFIEHMSISSTAVIDRGTVVLVYDVNEYLLTPGFSNASYAHMLINGVHPHTFICLR